MPNLLDNKEVTNVGIKAYGRHLNPGMKKMSTSVRAFCTSRPVPNETLEEPIHWRRGEKAMIFYVGEGVSRGLTGAAPFPFECC